MTPAEREIMRRWVEGLSGEEFQRLKDGLAEREKQNMWEPKQVACVECGAEFVQRKSWQVYCSKQCRDEVDKEYNPVTVVPADLPFMDRRDIAGHMGISKSAVEQIEVKALRHLRLRGVNMRDFL